MINYGMPLKSPRLWLGAILGLTFLVFFPCLKAGFLEFWDDDYHLTRNSHCFSLSPEGIDGIFHSTVNKTYIPLTTLSYAVEYHFFGLNPFVYHLDNVLLHLIVVGLIWLLAQRLGLSPVGAAAASMIFALHPMHVESVAWVTGRKDMLYSIFYLLSLIGYSDYLTSRRRWPYAVSLLCGFLSILAKPLALSLPLVLVLMDLHRQRPARQWIMDKIPYLLLMMPVVWQTYALQARNPHALIGAQGLLIWTWSAAFYVQKFFFPAILIPLYNLPRPVSLWTWDYAQAILTLGLCAVLVFKLRRNRWIVGAFLFYIVSTFFLWRWDDFDVSIVADRFMYLPSLGFCLWLGSLAENLPKLRWLLPMALLLALITVKTSLQTAVWRDDLTLWNYVLAHSPDNPTAYRQRGMTYGTHGQYKESLQDFNKLIGMYPKVAENYNNRGYTYLLAGNTEAAKADFIRAVVLAPGFTQAWTNLYSLRQKQR